MNCACAQFRGEWRNYTQRTRTEPESTVSSEHPAPHSKRGTRQTDVCGATPARRDAHSRNAAAETRQTVTENAAPSSQPPRAHRTHRVLKLSSSQAAATTTTCICTHNNTSAAGSTHVACAVYVGLNCAHMCWLFMAWRARDSIYKERVTHARDARRHSAQRRPTHHRRA